MRPRYASRYGAAGDTEVASTAAPWYKALSDSCLRRRQNAEALNLQGSKCR